MMQEKINVSWPEHLGNYLPPVLLIGFLGWGGINAIAHIPVRTSEQPSSTITVTRNMMRIDGKEISVVTSEFTPNGKFTIGKPIKDPLTGVTGYPFLASSWQSMPDKNPLKARIQRFEERTGKPQSVAYTIHPGEISYGCVVLPKRLNEISSRLEGRQIEIKTGEG